jgi:UDP-perosamine 4-acetyltransferase
MSLCRPAVNSTGGNLVLIGGGGHAGVVAAAAHACGYDVAGYVGPPPLDQDIPSLPWLGDDSRIGQIMQDNHAVAAFPALGCVNRSTLMLRRQVIEPLWGLQSLPLVHPDAYVARTARIGAGTFVAAGAVISDNTCIGRGCIINTGVVVDHDCQVEDGCHLATGARVAGGVNIASWCLIGAGATVIQGLRIASGTILGAGSVLLDDTLQGQTLVGHPALARS